MSDNKKTYAVTLIILSLAFFAVDYYFLYNNTILSAIIAIIEIVAAVYVIKGKDLLLYLYAIAFFISLIINVPLHINQLIIMAYELDLYGILKPIFGLLMYLGTIIILVKLWLETHNDK